MQKTKTGAVLLGLLAACFGAACEDDDEASVDRSQDVGEDAGTPDKPLYALTTNVWGTEGATGYLYTVDSVASGEPSLDRAVELPGGAWLTAREGEPSVYVSSGEGGPTITRWDVDEQGELKEGTTISFEQLGFTTGMRFGTAPIVSETKAYLVDPQQHLIAAWNPKSMRVGKLIELELEQRDGLPAWIPSAVVRDGQLLVTAVWEDDSRFAPSSQVIVIDTESDEIINVHEETRCEQLAIHSADSDGTVYYSAYAHSSAARKILGDAYGARACALRVLPRGAAPDEGWEVDLSELADGRPAGEFILASDELGFFRAFYNEDVEATRETWQDKQGAPSYRWWKWEIGSDRAEELPDQELTVEAAHYVLDGKTYVGNPSANWAETTIVELQADGTLHEGAKLKGTPGGVFRVR